MKSPGLTLAYEMVAKSFLRAEAKPSQSTPALDMFLHNWHLGVASSGGPTTRVQFLNRLFVGKYKMTGIEELFASIEELSGLECSEEVAGGSCDVERVAEPLQ